MGTNYRNKILEFEKVEGRVIARQPWPVRFFVSEYFIAEAGYDLRPLTVTSFFRSVFRNFVTMNYHRFLTVLWKLGFFTTKEYECFSWRHFTLKFWVKKK